MSITSGLPHHDSASRGNAELRFSRYREDIRARQELGDNARASYYLANLALEELAVQVNSGEEPTDSAIAQVEYRFGLAADINSGKETLEELRSRLLGAWVLPIVWSGIVNLEGLTTTQAHRVADRIGLKEAGDTTADIVADALRRADEIDLIHPSERDDTQIQDIKLLVGFLNEATVLQLGVRHNTAKQFALPSTAYDDRIDPDVSRHVDGFYYDNRRVRGNESRFAYQTATMLSHPHIGVDIPEINARELGNLVKTSWWPHDDRKFGTARRLVTERRGKKLSRQAASTLDRIASSVFNKITQK